eukprot:g46131.t1
MGWGSVQLLLLVLIPPGSQAGAPLSAGCLSCEKLWKVKERTVHGDDSGLLRPRVSADELGSGAAPPLEADSRLGLKPGMAAPPFTLETLNGKLSYPAIPEQPGLSFTFQAFTNKSGFLECLWSSTASLVALVDGLPPHTHLVFMSFDDSAPGDVRWMKQQLIPVMEARVLKENGEEIVEALVVIFQESLKSGRVPEDWKMANSGYSNGHVLLKHGRLQLH